MTRDPDLLTQDDIGRWLGYTGGLIRQIRAGKWKLHAPFPKSDLAVEHKNRSVALWNIDRLPEIVDWYRKEIRWRAEREIAAMEANVRCVRAAREAAVDTMTP